MKATLPVAMVALLGALLIASCEAHIYAICPKARNCFYHPPSSDSNGSDRQWNSWPCGWDPNPERRTILVQGSTLCLGLQEWVQHPGYYNIRMAGSAVRPSQSPDPFDPANGGMVLLAYEKDETNRMGIHKFKVTLPASFTGTATIQFRQWAEDFDYYYYSCTDVLVVAPDSDLAGQAECSFTSDAECSFEDADGGLIDGSLFTIIAGGLLAVCALFLVAGLASQYCLLRRRACFASIPKEPSRPDGASAGSAWSAPVVWKDPRRHALFKHIAVAAAMLLVLALAWFLAEMLLLTTCSYGGDDIINSAIVGTLAAYLVLFVFPGIALIVYTCVLCHRAKKLGGSVGDVSSSELGELAVTNAVHTNDGIAGVKGAKADGLEEVHIGSREESEEMLTKLETPL